MRKKSSLKHKSDKRCVKSLILGSVQEDQLQGLTAEKRLNSIKVRDISYNYADTV